MKKLLILAALLTVGAGAFAQAKAGSLGIKASVAGSTNTIGLDYYLLPEWSAELGGYFALNSRTSDAVQRIPSTSESTTARTSYGVDANVYFRWPVVANLDVGLGPGGYWGQATSQTTYAAMQNASVGTQTVRFGSTLSTYTSYGATLGVQLKYFLGTKLAVFTKVGGGFGTTGTKDEYLNTSGQSLAEVDASYYEFYTTTPAVGVVFYLN